MNVLGLKSRLGVTALSLMVLASANVLGAGNAPRDLLPAKIRDAGVIKVASDVHFPPMEYIPEGEKLPIGLDVDLANALGDVLGVKFEFVNTQFSGIVAAIQAGRYDIGMSAINNTKARSEQVNFVDYLINPGTSAAVLKGNPEGIKAESDLCGKRVAVLTGTTQQEQLGKISEACKAAGKPLVTVLPFPLESGALLALKSNRASATVAGGLPVAYHVKVSNGALEGIPLVAPTIRYGIAVTKSNTELLAALQSALKEVMAKGTYDEIIKKWGAEKYGIK